MRIVCIRIFYMKNVYLIADTAFLIEYNSVYTEILFKEYLSSRMPEFTVLKPNDSQIEYEKSLCGIDDYDVLENTYILRQISKILLENKNTVLFHSSAVKYKEKAYLFTAPSGTGKSTHTRNLKTLLKDKISYINDDKPFISLGDDGNFYVYGSPWCGKHRLGANEKVPLKAIVLLSRAKDTSVEKISGKDALKTLVEQSSYQAKIGSVDKLFSIFSSLIFSVDFYKLTCNKEVSSASVTLNEILEG